MRKNFLLGIGVVAFAVTLAFNTNIIGSNAQTKVSLSNIEALARDEWGFGCQSGCSTSEFGPYCCSITICNNTFHLYKPWD